MVGAEFRVTPVRWAMKCPKCQRDNPETSRFCGDCGTPLRPAQGIPASQDDTLEVAVRELTTGSLFAGRYQVIEELGKGGMGRVYKVLDTKLNEKVALKLLKPEIASDRETIERFGNELKLARKISQRHVCRVFDLGKAEGAHYLTMEYVPGQDLKGLIRQAGQLTVGKAISISKEICEGLAEAHRLGVVHRDLKPSNIMIDHEGNVRIMDFGIARSLKGRDTTGMGVLVGTPEYMSPEQVEGKEADQRSDIYSLGIVLYEMLTGHVPFEGETPISVATKHKSELAREPRELNPQIPEDLNRLVLKCLAKEKEKRYQSARDLFDALSNLQVSLSGIDKPQGRQWEHSIAVLPFTDLSPQKDQEYFCDGMAEELINVLSQIRGLKVVARTSAFSFKGKHLDVHELGKRLGVDRILEGSVRKAGDRLRISAQLIDVSEGCQLWSERFDREMKDVFAIQDEVTLAIVEKFKIQLLDREKDELLRHRLQDVDTYELYLKGRHFLNKRTEDGFHKAITYFRKMIEKNASSSLGYAGLADAHDLMGYFNYLKADEAYSRAKEAAEKALALDETLAEAHTSLAGVKLFFDRNFAEAERDLRRAIRLNSSYITAHHRLAFCLSAQERHEDAMEEILRAKELDPLSPMINGAAAWVFYLARRYDWVIDQCEKIREIDPDYHVAYAIGGLAFLELDSFDKAISFFQKALELEAGDIASLGYLGIAYAKVDRMDDARKILKEIEDRSKRRYVSPLYRAMLLTGLGQVEQALEWLEIGFQERIPWMVFLKVWPLFDGLKSEPRYNALIGKLLPEHA
jgi:serine/threonine protein kinase/Flp pilus assembly protein TadD